MSSFIETIQKKRFLPTRPYKDDLPISQSMNQKETLNIGGLRKRISSFSMNVRPLSNASSSWAFRKSKSMSSLGEYASGPFRRWWNWIISRKLAFAKDIEMNEEESAFLGFQSKGSLKHVFYKVRSEIKKLVRSETLPTTSNEKFKYDSF